MKERYIRNSPMESLWQKVNFGMKLNSIAKKANINDNELSLYKNGFKYLKKDDAERLDALLKQISVPSNA